MRKVFIALVGLLAFLPMAFAAYFTNVPQVKVQPNGDTLRCFATGDEYFHRLHDADGYTIVLDPSTGYYVYADKVGDALVPTNYIAGRTNPAEVGIVPNLSISAEQWRARRERWEEPARSRAGMRDGYNHGHINNIVIFIRFADDTPCTNQFDDVERMFNDATPGYSSMYNFFKAASYDQLTITSSFFPTQSGSTILSYQDSYSRSYFEPYSYANPNGYATDDNDADRTYREHMLLSRAVNAVADMVPADLDIDYDNNGFVDNVVFVIRGNVGDWNDLLWPHRWSLWTSDAYSFINGKQVWDFNLQLADATSYFNTSVLCHEMNHSLGAPDLYHYYNGTDMEAVSTWDLMHQNTNPPQHMGAYMKYKYGHWIESIPEITECGTYSLHSLGSSATNNCYKIASPNPDEYFVLEYRNKNDLFESTLPTSGLLVYRINTNFDGNAMWDGVNVFDEVYIFRPNGTPTSNGSIWNAAFAANLGRTMMNETTNPQPFLTDGTVLSVGDFTIRNISEAGGDSMTFTFCDINYLQITPASLVLDAEASSSSSVHVASDMGWEVTGDCDWLTFSPVSGNGEGNIMFTTVTENNDFTSRSCTITVTASNNTQQTITVIQRGQQPYLEAEVTDPVSGTTGILDHANSTCNIDIRSNVAWTVEANVSWVGFSQVSGEGNASLTVTALSENTTCLPRYATITINSQYGQSVILRVMQNSFSEGSLVITPATLTIENSVNATAQLTVSATDEWDVLSSPSWLSVSPNEGGVNDHSITLSVTSTNSNSSSRTGVIVVSDICGRTDSEVHITVTQPEGYIRLSESQVILGSQQGSSATAELECSGNWYVAGTSVPEWLSVAPTTGSGNQDITFSALSNNTEDDSRVAVVRFIYTLSLRVELLVKQDAATGIVDVAEIMTNLYPNPVTDLLTFDMEGSFLYTVYDASGRTVMRGHLSANDNTLSVSNLESGIYYVRFNEEKTGKTTVAKFVKR